ncbi:MAG: lytic transglycosylase domain-containing protein [Patescibacteria group bacterium]|nr:lytic transglycosylase domain-containing protein [Patescibacteria group bacterium]
MKALMLFLAFFLVIVVAVVSHKTPQAKKFDAQEYLARTNNQSLLPVVRAKYGKMIRDVCRKEKVPLALRSGDVIEKIIIIESSGNPEAEKAGDGIGLMGVKPSTAIAYGVNPKDLKSPHWNLLAGIRHLGALVDSLDGNVPAAIVAYNCGLKNYQSNYLATGVSPLKARYFLKVKTLTEVERQYASAE